MQLEKKGYVILNDIDFVDEMKKLLTNGEVFYVGDIQEGTRTSIYHAHNTTIIANSRQLYIIGQLVEIERTRKNLETTLNIKLKE